MDLPPHSLALNKVQSLSAMRAIIIKFIVTRARDERGRTQLFIAAQLSPYSGANCLPESNYLLQWNG
jgi:hypothetical protein